MPSVAVQARELRVGANHAITFSGGSISLRGSREEIASQLASWRAARRGSGDATGAVGDSARVALEQVDLAWADAAGPGSVVRARGLSVPDVLHATSASAVQLDVESSRGQVRAERVRAAWTQQKPPQVHRLQAGALRAEVMLDGREASDEVPPADAPSAARFSSLAPPTSGSPAAKPAPNRPAEPWPSPHDGDDQRQRAPLRDRLSQLASMAWAPLAADAKVEVEALEVTVHRGADRVTLGPGKLAAEQSAGRVLIDLAPPVDRGKRGITFRASVPVGAGSVVLDVVGGPIALATLGVREGELGLERLREASLEADAHLKLHEDGRSVSVDGILRFAGVNIRHPKLAARPVQGLQVAAKLRGRAALDGSFLEVQEGEVDVGRVQVRLRGVVDRSRPKMRVDVYFGMPIVSCQAFLDALPETLIPVVHGMRAAGTMSLDGHLRFDDENIGDFLLDYQAGNACRVTSVPAHVDARRFRSTFRRAVYDQKGARAEIESGPGSPEWTELGGITHFMEAAVMTTEDGRFRGHRGFDHEAIRKSVRENLRARSFVRGASTISMQLAKNLYLERDKTVSRKLQELILTVYLEQALTKDQIMELYLNVIEFGPMCYGIQCAARQYFRTSPHILSLSQSMYIASILPNPVRQHFARDGRVSEGWTQYLQKLMRIAAKLRWISEQELEVGLGEWVVYGSPEPLRQEPQADAQVEPSSEQVHGDEPFGWRQGAQLAY
jgi:hypothetical protein